MNMYLCVFPTKLLGKGRNIIPFPLRKFFPSDHKFLPRSTPPPLGLLFCLKPITLLYYQIECSPGLCSQSSSHSVASSWPSFSYLCLQLNLSSHLLFAKKYMQLWILSINIILYPYTILITIILFIIIPTIVYCYIIIQIIKYIQ